MKPARLAPFVSVAAARHHPGSGAASPAAPGWAGWLDGTLVSVDIAGFTPLTENLARRGRVGAETLMDLVDGTFAGMVHIFGAEGGDVLRFGGDALRVLYEGEEHAARAVAGGLAVQAWMRGQRVGDAPVRAPGPSPVRARVGVHTGRFAACMAGTAQRELVVAGPAATRALAAEAVARAGTVVATGATTRRLRGARLRPGPDDGSVVRSIARPSSVPVRRPVRVAAALVPAAVAELAGRARHGEHRIAAVGFVRVRGLDRSVQRGGPEALAARVAPVVEAVEATSEQFELCWLNTDVVPDGLQLTLTAGVPRGVEHAEERILRAARAIADTGGPQVAVGVAAGMMFAAQIGDRDRRTYTIMGDVVNSAARLSGLARRGGVLATAAAVGKSQTRFRHGPVRALTVKGRRAPLDVVPVGPALTRDLAVSAGDPASVDFVGRSRELRTLTRALGTLAGGRGGVVEVVGEAGVGKTRLLEAFLTRGAATIERARALVLRAGADPYGANDAFGAVRELLRAWAPELLGPSVSNASVLRRVAGDAAAGDRDETGATDAMGDSLVDITTAVVQSLEAGRRGPVICIVEDTQWLDGASRALLDAIARRAAERQWLIVVTRRTGAPVIAPDAGATTLRLGPLDVASVRRLIVGVAPPMTGPAIDALVRRSGGSPLAALEMARLGDATLPATVERLLALRIDRLPPADRDAVRDASVFGTTIDLALAAEVTSDARLANRLRAQREFFAPDERGLRFRHDLLRVAAYEGLAVARRRALHERAARLLSRRDGAAPATVALHARAAGDDRLVAHWGARARRGTRRSGAPGRTRPIISTPRSRRPAPPVAARAAVSRWPSSLPTPPIARAGRRWPRESCERRSPTRAQR